MTKFAVSASSPTSVTIAGRDILTFGGCNYLGLSHHPAVHAALLRGLQQFGVSTSASRETTGNTVAHDRLEQDLTSFLGVSDSVVVPDGYTANLAIAEALPQLLGPNPACIVDRRAHRSVHKAIDHAGLERIEYEHADAAHAAVLAASAAAMGRGVAILTDGVFTTDGALAPIPELLRALPRRGLLIVDDCHGFATLGPRGQGSLSHFGIDPEARIILTTTLAKGLGCHGGVVAGSSEVCRAVRVRGSAYMCTTPTSPAVISAASEALSILVREPERVGRVQRNARRLREGLRGIGLSLIDTPAPIAAFVCDAEPTMRRMHDEMFTSGILAPVMSYPGGPAPFYFRCSITSEHTPEQVSRLTEALASCMASACIA